MISQNKCIFNNHWLSPCERSEQGGSKFNRKKKSPYPCTWCQKICLSVCLWSTLTLLHVCLMIICGKVMCIGNFFEGLCISTSFRVLTIITGLSLIPKCSFVRSTCIFLCLEFLVHYQYIFVKIKLVSIFCEYYYLCIAN